MDPSSLGLGVWVAVGASQPGLWEVGLQGSRLVVCWGSGTGGCMGGRLVSGWAPGVEQLFLAAETFVLVHMWWRTSPRELP